MPLTDLYRSRGLIVFPRLPCPFADVVTIELRHEKLRRKCTAIPLSHATSNFCTRSYVSASRVESHLLAQIVVQCRGVHLDHEKRVDGERVLMLVEVIAWQDQREVRLWHRVVPEV